jgi:hypothetical protein
MYRVAFSSPGMPSLSPERCISVLNNHTMSARCCYIAYMQVTQGAHWSSSLQLASQQHLLRHQYQPQKRN